MIAGYADGFYADEEPVVDAINKAAPDVVFVCMGFPKAERFMAKYPELGVMLSIGGAVDVFAGDLKRAPAIMRKLGLEWLCRLIAQPSRWKRMRVLPKFLWLAIRRRVSPNGKWRMENGE